MYGGNADVESGSMPSNFDQFNSFTEESIRKGFIRKVYAILCCQVLVTMAIMSMFIYIDEVKYYSIHNPWMWYLAFAMTIVTLIVLACCPEVRRNYPINFILLAVFTVCEGFLLGTVASHYDEDTVLIAVGVTAVVCLSLTLFAFQTKIDFTMMGGLLFVFFIILFCFGILCLIIRSRFASLAYACIGALLFSAYLVFDTQLMLGGKHKYALSPEEHIFAALNLYLDIINIFIFILSIFGLTSD
ncbi:protein lifeguard 1-like [Gigantopelta aegis]|uniref:protein lifeguard 1-like n=1 Tax=Gigantopelta aegis TaxID=1735272 RepID=UPI001B88CCE6|nr:protein lifeguard 1-like [Gigantopelta aegis]